MIEIETRYVPVPITLEPRESVNSKLSTRLHVQIALTFVKTKDCSASSCNTVVRFMLPIAVVRCPQISTIVACVLTSPQASLIHSWSSLSTGRRCTSLPPRRRLSTPIGMRISLSKWYDFYPRVVIWNLIIAIAVSSWC